MWHLSKSDKSVGKRALGCSGRMCRMELHSRVATVYPRATHTFQGRYIYAFFENDAITPFLIYLRHATLKEERFLRVMKSVWCFRHSGGKKGRKMPVNPPPLSRKKKKEKILLDFFFLRPPSSALLFGCVMRLLMYSAITNHWRAWDTVIVIL